MTPAQLVGETCLKEKRRQAQNGPAGLAFQML